MANKLSEIATSVGWRSREISHADVNIVCVLKRRRHAVPQTARCTVDEIFLTDITPVKRLIKKNKNKTATISGLDRIARDVDFDGCKLSPHTTLNNNNMLS